MTELDEALERFQRVGPEYAGGLANHGPMAAEALERLGHPALIPAWVERYAPRLPPAATGRVLRPEERPEQLGRFDAWPDWVATFEAELAERPWPEVAAAGVRALLPGFFAAATHGWLRAAHAVRALEAVETPVRRRELAFGLGYWAARYQTLPGRPGAGGSDGRNPAEFLRQVSLLPEADRRPGLFTEAVGPLADFPAFAAEVDRLAEPAAEDVEAALGELCRAAVELYWAQPTQRVAALHAVTAPGALRLLAPVLDADTRRRALLAAAQAAAALRSATAVSEPRTPDPEIERCAEDEAEIRYRAACSLEEHAIKFAEACLREHRLSPAPVWRRAAADAALRLAPDDRRAC